MIIKAIIEVNLSEYAFDKRDFDKLNGIDKDNKKRLLSLILSKQPIDINFAPG